MCLQDINTIKKIQFGTSILTCKKSDWLKETFSKSGLKQLGTLGSGNHFIEIGYDEQDSVWLSVHSGSRNIGHNVGSHYIALASGTEKPKEGFYSLHTKSVEAQKYWMDMNFCLAFAQANREAMLGCVERAISRYVADGCVQWGTMINHNHNHVELCLNTGLWIHRKGAVEAYKGQYGVVAGTMQDGLFIVRGKGNPESLCSCSHGAGRVMGRNEASKKLSMEDFSKGMEGITASVCQETLDEAKGAYKDIFEVMACQDSLVEVVAHVKPIINIKHKEKKRK